MPVDYQEARRKISEKSVRSKKTNKKTFFSEKLLVILHMK